MYLNRKKRLFTAIEILILFTSLALVRCEFYTSVAGLESLLDSELYLLEVFEDYVKDVEITNKKIENFLDDIGKTHEEFNQGLENYSLNPLNAFKTIKRLTFDWKVIEQLLLLDSDGQKFAANFTSMKTLGYDNATEHDLLGASNGLVRLQKTYALETSDIIDGILMGYDYETTLSAHDAFILGRSLFAIEKNNASVDWLLQARISLYNEELHQRNKNFPQIRDVQILEFLAPSLFRVGNSKMAVLLNEELLAQEPNNSYGLKNKLLFDTHIHAERSILLDLKKPPMEQDPELFEVTEAVCRGSLHQTPAEKRNLRCRYVSNNMPFCIIAPFKMEELSIDPAVSIYHDVIYENEMDNIISAAKETIERSTLGGFEKSDYRTSKTSWLLYHKHSFLNAIKNRLHHITGLSWYFANPLQVVNYGIGGHYGVHYDAAEHTENAFRGKGNRIVTALFYINDVELGGGTAFPYLRLLVPPETGSLLVWNNLHDSYELDYRTLHAGCPVLKGSKWICNEWFHEIGQEFTRPCSSEKKGNISLPFRNVKTL